MTAGGRASKVQVRRGPVRALAHVDHRGTEPGGEHGREPGRRPWHGVALAAGVARPTALHAATSVVAHPGLAATGLFLQRTVDGLSGPVVATLRQTLLGPLSLSPAVASAWDLTRDIGFALLTAALLYAVLRAQLARPAGVDADEPWAVLPRLALAALGVAASLPLVRGLLAASNALTATLASALPHASDLMRPLTAGLALSLVPAILDIGADVVALLLLVGVAALACFYLLRAAEVVLLTLLLPIAAALWVVPAAAGVWRAVLGELLVSIFVQPAQAAVLLVFAAGLTPAPGQPASWMWGVAALALLFRVRALLAAAVSRTGRWGTLPSLAGVRAAAGGSAALADRIAALTARLPQLPGI